MTANEVGFDGSIRIYSRMRSRYKIKFARSTEDKGPNVWHTSVNPNINGKFKNTFVWWNKNIDPELYYINHEGRLFTVKFEPVENL
jgi:hypothetical protein